VSCGFLTAAYLMWFRELGYAWALQAYLDPVREQIRRPEEAILPRNFSAVCPGHVFEEPWIGIGRVRGELVLLAGLGDRLVFLPPFDRKDFYASLPTDYSGSRVECTRFLRFFKGHAFQGPVAVLFEARLIVAPDVFFRTREVPVIFFAPDGSGPHICRQITQEQFDRLGELPDVKTLAAAPILHLPDGEMGRPTSS
jgi:hypothetical protein